MSEPIIINVILKPDTDTESTSECPALYMYAAARLNKWFERSRKQLRINSLAVGEEQRFAIILTDSRNLAERIIKELTEQEYIDSAYLKPMDEAP